MPNLTQEQMSALAIFAGCKPRRSHEEGGCPSRRQWFLPPPFKCPFRIIDYEDWNPLRPEHGDLVLKALAGKIGWREMLEGIIKIKQMRAGWIYDAGCDMALAIIEHKGRING